MKNIINLTQHRATDDQLSAGVVDLSESFRSFLCELLTFDALPNAQEIEDRALKICALVNHYHLGEPTPSGSDRELDGLLDDGTAIYCMIGGAPFLMSALEAALVDDCRIPLYAFSKRVSVEIEADGKLIKINEFHHLGFVEV